MIPSPVLVLQHAQSEGLGSIEDALQASGHTSKYLRTFAGDTVPLNSGDSPGLIIMGGPMGVYEHNQYPFLRHEMKLIESFLKAGKPILGVCLGSQLLAAALGAEVKKGPRKEIGWYPIRLGVEAKDDAVCNGQPESFVAFHWHGDIFELPHGAVPLASSELTRLQAFRHGDSAYGVLFHMEVTSGQIQNMVREFAGEIEQEKLDGGEILAQSARFLPEMRNIGSVIFSRWTRLMKAEF